MRTMMVRPTGILLILALLSAGLVGIVEPPVVTQAAPPPGFAYRCGIHFCLDGNRFYFAGANTYDLFTYGDGSSTSTPEAIETRFMDKARIDAHFARLQGDNVSVLRLWMFSHETWHGFETAKGVYSEPQFMLFDYIIESAKAHNVRLIPVFENYWEAYGGIDTRLQWEGLSGGQANRWKFFNRSQCPGCFTQYKNYVSYVLNRVNHYSGIAYKNEPTIFAWELMNEPRYQDATPNENSTGTTLRAWVDEMGAFIKSIDPNHMLGTGLEGHETRYGFGGNEGNPFIYIHQSPAIDFTSAHPYPTEPWANLTINQMRVLLRAWISDSHTIVGKPFYMGEFNTHTGSRTEWWSAIFSEMEASDGDGSGFWWYDDRIPTYDSKFGVNQGAPELAVFRQHALRMQAKNLPDGPTVTPGGPTLTPTATRTPTPTPNTSTILRVQYKAQNTNPNDGEITPHFKIVNTSTNISVPLSELKLRYWYSIDGDRPQQFSCFWAQVGCANINAALVPLATPIGGMDYYLELGFGTGAGSIAGGGSSGEIHTRLNKSDWSAYNESNDYSFDATKLAFADWNRVTLYRNGVLVWGNEPGASTEPSATATATATRTATPTATSVGPSATATATATRTATPTATSAGPSATPTRTPSPTATSGSSVLCQVTYTVTNQWTDGFTADVTIKNNGAAINGWTLSWTFAGNQTITNMWNATLTQSGQNVSARDVGWNASLSTGGTASFGFQASFSGSNSNPTLFRLNGVACN